MSKAQPGYVITVFRSRLRPEFEHDYRTLATELLELAKDAPGFVSLDRFTSEDGERLSIVTFESAETELAWRDQARHREAQRLGRERFFSEYSIAVCECIRAHSHRSA